MLLIANINIISSHIVILKIPPFFFDYMQLGKGSQERSLYDIRF